MIWALWPVGVTFIQPSKKVQYPFPKILYVRQRVVFAALKWLQSNNGLWHDIVIDSSRINDLPENGVPSEIVNTARISDKISVLSTEQSGYVPEPLDDDDTGANLCVPKNRNIYNHEIVFNDLYPNESVADNSNPCNTGESLFLGVDMPN